MRGYRNYGSYSSVPGIDEKLICVLSYLTAGLVGFIWIILSTVTKKTLKPFVKFHAYQSVFLSILFYVIRLVINIILGVLGVIPFIGTFFKSIAFNIATYPILFGFSILHIAVVAVIGYLVFNCLKGQHGNLPWVSDNIRRMI